MNASSFVVLQDAPSTYKRAWSTETTCAYRPSITLIRIHSILFCCQKVRSEAQNASCNCSSCGAFVQHGHLKVPTSSQIYILQASSDLTCPPMDCAARAAIHRPASLDKMGPPHHHPNELAVPVHLSYQRLGNFALEHHRRNPK